MSIISSLDSNNHNIQKYSFASLDNTFPVVKKEETKPEKIIHKVIEESVIQQNNIIDNKHEEKIQQLLEKIEELSSNVVKLQMKQENKQVEFNTLLEDSKQSAFDKGKIEGETQTRQLLETSTNELKDRFLQSIETIKEELDNVDKWIIHSKKEIPLISFDIATEVVKKEIHKNSKEIAYSLTNSLLEDIKKAKNIKIKLHPKDYKYVKANFDESKNITFEKDEAISQGGVVIFSDYGNIDGNLKIRLLKAKELILESE